MVTVPLLLSVCVALVGYSRFADAAYGDACDTDSDCTAADNTLCNTSPGCAKGACTTCKTNYILSGGACLKDNGQTCGANTECASNVCSTTCGCGVGETWDTTYKACVTDTKAWGDACDAASPDADNDCHVAATTFNGACTGAAGATVCDCAAGYVKDTGYVCRLPYYGEACDGGNSPACQSRSNTGEQVPVCTNSVCVCDTGDEEISYNGISFCSTTVAAANKLVDTLTCTSHNECNSGMCVQCPDTPVGTICASQSSSSMTKSLVALVVSTIVGLLYF